MRKFLMWAALASILSTQESSAQFIGASLPQVNYPVTGTAQTHEPNHMSSYNYHHNDAGFSGFLNVHSWSNPYSWMPNNAGIAFSFTDNTFSTVYDAGFLNISNALEVEVGTILVGGMKVIAVTYHNGSGAFVDFYHYVFPGTLNPIGSHLLSSSGKRPRIDSHLDYALVITYEDATGIQVAAIESSTFPTITTETVASVPGAGIPDVAFGHTASGLMTKVVYYAAGSIYVMSKDFWQIGMPTIPYVTEDVNTMVQTEYIDIDAPDHNPSMNDNWAYTYSMSNKLYVRSKVTGVVAPFLFAVNDPFLMTNYNNFKPSIAYEYNLNNLTIGWAAKSVTSLTNKNVAVRYRIDGSPLTTPGNYLLLSTGPLTTDYGKFNVVALSKNNEIPYVFTAFSMRGPGSPINEDIIVKVKPTSMPTFRDEVSIPTPSLQLQAIPNPFQSNFMLDASTLDGTKHYQVQIVDIAGKTVLQQSGTIDAINASLITNSEKWPTGVYSIQLQGDNVLRHLKVVKQ